MKEKELIEKIEQWAEERNLIKGSTIKKQILKMIEEFSSRKKIYRIDLH